MAEYIERASLINYVKDLPTWGADGNLLDREDVISSIENHPASDVVPVRHGRWVEKEKYTFGIMYDCSLCENRILDNGHPWNYCPNCGARMDLED